MRVTDLPATGRLSHTMPSGRSGSDRYRSGGQRRQDTIRYGYARVANARIAKSWDAGYRGDTVRGVERQPATSPVRSTRNDTWHPATANAY
ncbi:hypothetical protein Val02_85130 [Virgisporangium aliadipatigenens]|uniref:Uncharacterized protein n=1 Tax=Virgisporangium aliadipatigenens TaxID=741659 RepID=A0A8J4DX15_9ACTN|nr:hypothetical protein Val02_85130 [Virgisporangium aliadipatigenens]